MLHPFTDLLGEADGLLTLGLQRRVLLASGRHGGVDGRPCLRKLPALLGELGILKGKVRLQALQLVPHQAEGDLAAPLAPVQPPRTRSRQEERPAPASSLGDGTLGRAQALGSASSSLAPVSGSLPSPSWRTVSCGSFPAAVRGGDEEGAPPLGSPTLG